MLPGHHTLMFQFVWQFHLVDHGERFKLWILVNQGRVVNERTGAHKPKGGSS